MGFKIWWLVSESYSGQGRDTHYIFWAISDKSTDLPMQQYIQLMFTYSIQSFVCEQWWMSTKVLGYRLESALYKQEHTRLW